VTKETLFKFFLVVKVLLRSFGRYGHLSFDFFLCASVSLWFIFVRYNLAHRDFELLVLAHEVPEMGGVFEAHFFGGVLHFGLIELDFSTHLVDC